MLCPGAYWAQPPVEVWGHARQPTFRNGRCHPIAAGLCRQPDDGASTHEPPSLAPGITSPERLQFETGTPLQPPETIARLRLETGAVGGSARAARRAIACRALAKEPDGVVVL